MTSDVPVALSASHRDTPDDVRRRLSLDPGQRDELLRRVGQDAPQAECLVLSTCHRSEVYLVGLDPAQGRRLLAEVGRTTVADTLHGSVVTGPDAVRHLARVTSGLESSLLGEEQIVAQVRAAAAQASAAGVLGPTLRSVVDVAVSASRKVRAATPLGASEAGLGSAVAAAVHARAGLFDTKRELRCLLLGSGEAARSIGRQLQKCEFIDVELTARNVETGARLATDIGATFVDWALRATALRDAHVVVTATGGADPVVTAADLAGSAVGLVVDVGFPRNVGPGVACDVVRLEDLATHQAGDDRARRLAVPLAVSLIDREVERWVGGRQRRAARRVAAA